MPYIPIAKAWGFTAGFGKLRVFHVFLPKK